MFQPTLSFSSRVRFDLGKLIQLDSGFYDVVTSSYMEALVKLRAAGSYKVTTERYRPDLISAKIYGREEYKMMLLAYNGLFTFLQVEEGVELKYPSLTDLEDLMFTQSQLTSARKTR